MNLFFRIFYFIYIFILLPVFLIAQTPVEDSTNAFLKYLLESQQYEDVVFLAKQQINSKQILNYSPQYYVGFAYYNIRELDSAAFYLGQVPENNIFYLKSRFFQGLSLSYLEKYNQSMETFRQIEPADSLISELQLFQFSGLALLEKNYEAFDQLSKKFTFRYYPFSKQESNFLKYKQDLIKVRKKSPVIAGMLSAVVPGSGKIYAGRLGQGVAAFLQNAVLGLQAYEGYRKDGIKSARFIIYGGLFTVFYIGNIWGSAITVKIKRQEMYDQINNQILFDMHIPLRTIFN